MCLSLSPKRMRALRGNAMSMIFQEPMTALNPLFTVGDQIGEVLRWHQKLGAGGRAGADHRAVARGRRFRPRSGGSTPIRISSPAACASA